MGEKIGLFDTGRDHAHIIAKEKGPQCGKSAAERDEKEGHNGREAMDPSIELGLRVNPGDVKNKICRGDAWGTPFSSKKRPP